MKKTESLHNYKKTLIDKLCDILLISLLPFLVFICVMILLTTKSHASTVNNHLPISPQYNNSALTQEDLITLLGSCDAQYNKDFTSGNYFAMFGDYRIFGRYNNIVELHCFVFKIPDIYNAFSNSITDANYNSFIWSNISDGITCNFDCIRYSLKYENGLWSPYGFSYSTANIKDMVYPTENTFFTYTSQVICYSTSNIYVNSNSYNKVLTLGGDVVPITLGHATPPEEFNTPIYPQGHAKPQTVPPTYTVNNYSWTTYTPPNVDNSTLEKLLESLTDIVKYNASYLSDNLHNEFTNLINNIKGLIDYIGETIQYYGDLIIENIQNFITTFYNNMLSLFEPISTAIDYISQPLDMDSLTETVNSTQIWGDVDTCTDFANDAFGIYGTVVEPNTFKIALDLRSIALLNISQVYYIDLSWLDDAKSAIRAFMWCVVTFGLLYSIIVDIPNMIRSSK